MVVPGKISSLESHKGPLTNGNLTQRREFEKESDLSFETWLEL